ncbi:hypothetical protein Cni_G16951 [Canna indica]|uniref:Oxidative stress 3 n=1 Tax=Canna indica TaxID=4628 RepID=A0AAQ3KG33_9LILI|nr:hypothetical protein Cni_G16951 [Canna indica]
MFFMDHEHGDSGEAPICESSSFSGDSDDSMFSSSSDDTDNATSSPSSSSSQGPLFEISSLMAELPIKRGLSKFYEGKSQSFTSLADARCREDLPKKETGPYRKRMKTCKSYAGGLDATQRPCFVPGPCGKGITKKTNRGSCASLMARSSSNLFCRSKPPIPLNKNL